AVDAAYPLYGVVALAPVLPLAAALADDHGTHGALVEAAIASRLGLKLGDQFRIGEAALELRAVIERQPDAAFGGLDFGPHVIISEAALAATGLIRPCALVGYEYRLRLTPGGDAAEWARSARAA